jgi:hypothetical protein
MKGCMKIHHQYNLSSDASLEPGTSVPEVIIVTRPLRLFQLKVLFFVPDLTTLSVSTTASVV